MQADKQPVNMILSAHEGVGTSRELEGYYAQLINTTSGRTSTLEFTYAGTPGVMVWCKDKQDDSAQSCVVKEAGKRVQ